MVDVGNKPVTSRRAIACGEISMAAETLDKIRAGDFGKGMYWVSPALPVSWGPNRPPA